MDSDDVVDVFMGTLVVGTLVGVIGLLAYGISTATSDDYEEVALCEDKNHIRVDEDLCQNTDQPDLSWVFISLNSNQTIGSYGQQLNPAHYSRMPQTGAVSYGGLKGVSNVSVNTVSKSDIGAKAYTGTSKVQRGGFGVTSAGSVGKGGSVGG